MCVHSTHGNVSNQDSFLVSDAAVPVVLSGKDVYVTLDSGINIGGTVGLQVNSLSGENALADSPGLSEPLRFAVDQAGHIESEKKYQRGGFRYLTVSHSAAGELSLSNLQVNWTASPEMENPRQY